MACRTNRLWLILNLAVAITACGGGGDGPDRNDAGQDGGEGEGEDAGQDGGEGEGEDAGQDGGEGEGEQFELLAEGRYVAMYSSRSVQELDFDRHYGFLHDDPYLFLLSADDDGVRHLQSIDLTTNELTDLVDIPSTESHVMGGTAFEIGPSWRGLLAIASAYANTMYLVSPETGEVRELGTVEAADLLPDESGLIVTEKCEDLRTLGCRAYLHDVDSGEETELAGNAMAVAAFPAPVSLVTVLHVDLRLEVLSWPDLEEVASVQNVSNVHHPMAPGQTSFYYDVVIDTDQQLWRMQPDGTSDLLKTNVYDVGVGTRAIYYTTLTDGAFVRDHGSDEERLVVQVDEFDPLHEPDNHLGGIWESPEGRYVVLNWSENQLGFVMDLDDLEAEVIQIPEGRCGGFRDETHFLYPCYDRPRLLDVTTGESGQQFAPIGHVPGISADTELASCFTADKRPGIAYLRLDDPSRREVLVAPAVSDVDEPAVGPVVLWAREPANVLYYITNNPGETEVGLFRYTAAP